MEESKIVKYILSECTEEEKIEITRWIEASSENRSHFQKLERTWLRSAALPAIEVNTEKAWKKFNAKHIQKRMFLLKPIYLAAASILIAGVLVIYFMGKQADIETFAFDANEMEQNVLFPDSSKATLVQGKLNYESDKSKKGMRVNLEGTAFFEVQSRPEEPFIIKTKNCSVTVLGTKFKVKSTESAVQVSVLEGKVAFKHKKEGKLLSAGESATLDLSTQEFRQKNVTDEFYQLNKAIIFNNTSLEKVAEILSHRFEAKVIVDPTIRDLKINSTFKNESLQTILEVLELTLNIDASNEESVIILKAK